MKEDLAHRTYKTVKESQQSFLRYIIDYKLLGRHWFIFSDFWPTNTPFDDW